MNDTPTKKILLTLDGSEMALETVKYVSKIQSFQNTEVTLFTVYGRIPEAYWDLEGQVTLGRKIGGGKDWEKRYERSIEEHLDKAVKILRKAGFSQDSIRVNRHEKEKGIARDIIGEAKQGYSCLLVGRKGESRIEELVLGSVSTKLIERITFVPLVVVGKDPQPRKILLALDGSESAGRALNTVANLLGGSDLEVRFIHVIRKDEKQYLEASLERIALVFIHATSRLLRSGFEPGQITNRVIHGVESRAAAIVQEAREGQYGTIVMGRRGLSRVKDFFIGRVSNKVLQLARDQAVWVVN